MKRGTATVSAEELRRAVKSDSVVSGFSRTRNKDAKRG